MPIRNRFYFPRATRHAIALMAMAAILSVPGFAKADDTTQQTDTSKKVATVKKDDTAKKQVAAAKPVDKDAKAVAESASKLNLATPVSNLKFYGDATVGYEASFGKAGCAGKNVRQDGMFSQFMVGTDVKLSKDVTMSVQVQAGQYPNGFGFH